MADDYDSDDYKDGDQALLDKIQKCRKAAKEKQADWRDEAREAFEFRDGDQWNSTDRAKLEEDGRPMVTFNRVGPVIDAVSGYELNNRREIRYLPRTVGDQDAALVDVYNATSKWVRDRCDAEDEESDAYGDAVTCGMGFVEIRIDYDEEPDGKIVMERVPPLEMRWDPNARKHNLGDRGWCLREKKWLKADIEAKWPKAEDIDWGSPDGQGDDWAQDHDSTQAREYRNSASPWSSEDKDRALVCHYQWREREPYYRLLDPQTNKLVDMPADRWKVLAKQFKTAGVELPQHVKQTRWVYKYAYSVGRTLLETDTNPVNDWTIHAITAKRDERMGTWYGLLRAMKDPQQWANKFFSQAMHIFQANSKGGVLVEQDAVPDLSEFERKWADPSGVAVVENGAISGGRIKEKDFGGYPASLDKLMQFAISSIRDTTGVNLEILGMTDREQSGVVEASRKQAALTVLAPFSNSLRRYRKMMGRTLLDFMRAFIPEGKMIRIAGPGGAEKVMPFVKSDESVLFDVVIDTAPNSPNLKMEVWGALQNMVPAMVKAGIQLPAELIRFSPLPDSVAEAWIKQEKDKGQVPPEIKAQMQQVQQKMQELTQENEALKGKQQQHMADLQAKREMQLMEQQGLRETAMLEAKLREMEIAAKMQISKADREAAMAEIEAKHNLEIIKLREEMALEREKASADIQIQREKMGADITVKREQTSLDRIQSMREKNMDIEAERELAALEGHEPEPPAEDPEEKRLSALQEFIEGAEADRKALAAKVMAFIEKRQAAKA